MLTIDNKYNIDFKFGPYVEIFGEEDFHYIVIFIDKKEDKIIYETVVKNNGFARCNRKYFTDWRISITELETDKTSIYDFDLKNKNVFISIDSKSLGDSIAWFAHIEEFQEKHRCNLYVSTFKNKLFINEYPNINFVDPGTFVDDIFVYYNIGWFYDENDQVRLDVCPREFKNLPFQSITTDILGLPQSELRPRITIPDSERPIYEDYICIAIHSTAQAKYWNNPNGWQEIVDHYTSTGLKVVLLSIEEDGYMGNKHPTGIIYPNKIFNESDTLDNAILYLNYAKFFIGIGSGLTWLSWAVGTPTVIISGFSTPISEPQDSTIIRIFNPNVCNGCFNRVRLDPNDWNWCPEHKGTDRHFECSKSITSKQVIEAIEMGWE